MYNKRQSKSNPIVVMTLALPSLEALGVVIITTKLTSWRVSVTITISRKPGTPQAISREKEPFRRNTALNRWVVSRPIKSRTCINAIISDSWYCGYQHRDNPEWCFYIHDNAIRMLTFPIIWKDDIWIFDCNRNGAPSANIKLVLRENYVMVMLCCVQAQIKENIKAPRHGPFTKGQ